MRKNTRPFTCVALQLVRAAHSLCTVRRRWTKDVDGRSGAGRTAGRTQAGGKFAAGRFWEVEVRGGHSCPPSCLHLCFAHVYLQAASYIARVARPLTAADAGGNLDGLSQTPVELHDCTPGARQPKCSVETGKTALQAPGLAVRGTCWCQGLMHDVVLFFS